MTKTIRSRANKNIGEIIEDCWEITAKHVIAEPHTGDKYRGDPPRLGIYDYEAKQIAELVPPPKTTAKERTARERASKEPSVGGTRREASSVPITVRRVS